MLTFCFTGVKGQMTEPEMLVSGMTGKQIRFLFSEEWAGLRKTAVYRAGTLSCTSEDIGELDVIPGKVLSKALRRLYVGVRGESEDGQVVIPTVMVPGPFIHIGTTEGPDYDPQDPDWKDVLRCTPQTLTEEQKAQARANIGITGGGLGGYAGALLLNLLRKAVFTEDVSGLILELEAALETPEVPETPQEPEKVYYSLSCGLEQVTADPASAVVEKGRSCTVVLTAAEGFVLDHVKVTMGGVDITGSAYANGRVTIGSVTGNVVITARAVEKDQQKPEGIFFVAASVYDNQINAYGLPSSRMSMVTAEKVAEVPFPQNGAVYDGDLYLLPVPAGTNVLTVESAGLIGGPQFFALENGVYTCKKDAGWQTEDGFVYEFEADAYDFAAINFKTSENSNFFTADYDTSGITAVFSVADAGEEPPEVTEVPITLSLTRTSVTNNQRTIQLGAEYHTMFVPAEGCFLDRVTVTMNGVDVTAEVLKNGILSIPEVTGAILVMAVSAQEPGDVTVEAIVKGSTSFVADAGLQINCSDVMTGRGTLVPVGQYLKKGCTYRFGIGSNAQGYYYGVQIMKASTADQSFPYTPGEILYYNTVVSREVDTGWMQEDYTYTPGEHNMIFTMNFKRESGEFAQEHYDELMGLVTIEEVTA